MSQLKQEQPMIIVITGTIGYTPSYLVATWVGNNDHTPMSGIVSGVTGAAPIWHDIITHILAGKKPEIPQKPPKVVGRYVCNGQPAPEGQKCSNRYEYFIKGAPTPKSGTTTTQKVFVDKSTNVEAKTWTKLIMLKSEMKQCLLNATGQKYCVSCARPSPVPNPKRSWQPNYKHQLVIVSSLQERRLFLLSRS